MSRVRKARLLPITSFAVLAFIGTCAAASAQTVPSVPAPGPVSSTPSADQPWTVSGIAGISAVQNAGGLFGVRIAHRVTDIIDVKGEASWMQDTVTRRTLDTANSVAARLQAAAGGQSTTGEVAAPTWSFTGGLSVDLSHGPGARFYVSGEGGAARISKQPTFTVGGTDVTENLGQYGIVLGEDLTGETTVASFGVGVGVKIPRGLWVIDIGASVLSLRSSDDTANVARVGVAIGRRF